MGLIKQTTSLTSVKFGKDRPGGGSSNQPYITSEIPNKRSGTTALDNILDKSTIKLERSAKDVSRLSQYFVDMKNFSGTGFIINQNLLSRQTSDLRGGSEGQKMMTFGLPGGVYNPINTVSQAGVVAFGEHYQKQGIVPKDSLLGNTVNIIDNIFNTNINNWIGNNGLNQPNYSEYYSVKEGNNRGYFKSRLEYLHNEHGYTSIKKQLGINLDNNLLDKSKFLRNIQSYSGKITDYIIGLTKNNKNEPSYINQINPLIKNRNNIIYSYPGGPGVLSKTNIRFYQNSLYPDIKSGSELYNEKYKEKVYENYIPLNTLTSKYLITLGESSLPLKYSNRKDNIPGAKGIQYVSKEYTSNKSIKKEKQVDIQNVSIGKGFTGDSFALTGDISGNESINKNNNGNNVFPKIMDFREGKAWNGVRPMGDIGDEGTPRIAINDPAHRMKQPDNTGRNFSKSNYIVDKINHSGQNNELYKSDDLIKFRIGVINRKGDTDWIQFRAFIDSFGDNYSSQWDEQQFMGRGEKFFKYKGFDRDIDLSFTVAALSKPELIPMYKKLNYLASTLAPNYGENGYMSGNLIKLTIGGYIYEVPGILQGINITPHEDTPWEIGVKYEGGDSHSEGNLKENTKSWDHDVKELPMVIKVTGFKFKPIHNFVPQIQKDYEKGRVRFISLATGDKGSNNNYD